MKFFLFHLIFFLTEVTLRIINLKFDCFNLYSCCNFYIYLNFYANILKIATFPKGRMQFLVILDITLVQKVVPKVSNGFLLTSAYVVLQNGLLKYIIKTSSLAWTGFSFWYQEHPRLESTKYFLEWLMHATLPGIA